MIYFIVLSSLIVHGLSVPVYKALSNIKRIHAIPTSKLKEWHKLKEYGVPKLRLLEWRGYRKGAAHFEQIGASNESLVAVDARRLSADAGAEARAQAADPEVGHGEA